MAKGCSHLTPTRATAREQQGRKHGGGEGIWPLKKHVSQHMDLGTVILKVWWELMRQFTTQCCAGITSPPF